MQQVAMTALPQPTQYDLRFLQDWLERPDMGNFAMMGLDRNVWGFTDEPTKHAQDIIVLRPQPHDDYFSTWIRNRLSWFHSSCLYRIKEVDLESGLAVYSNETVLRYTSALSTILASLLPIASIVFLYFIHSMAARLGVISGFTLVFCSCLTMFTSAKRGEVFAATAT
jgi:hypothetical protein